MKPYYIFLSLIFISFSCKRDSLTSSQTSKVSDIDAPTLNDPSRIKPFRTKVAKSDFGTLTTLIAETAISTYGSIRHKNKSLLANYVYREDETYKLTYTVIDIAGKDESYIEDYGILPTLFINPNHQNYVSV